MLDTEILLSIKLQQQLFVDPKRIRLLKEIALCGSINQAAKNAKVSYKSAWDHLEAMNKISPKPLLERNTGGKNGGGTQLTNYAKRLLQLYDLLEQTQEKAFQILHDENIELGSLLTATAKFSLQSSARNQFFGKVIGLQKRNLVCLIEIAVEGSSQPFVVSITEKSAARLQLNIGKEVMLMIKAPWVKLSQQKLEEMPNQFLARVESILDKEEFEEIILSMDSGLEFCATLTNETHFKQDEQLWLHIDPEQIVLATLY